MRHGVDGRKLGRNTSHRKALFKNLANAVIEREQIVTTVPKAKEARRVVDRLVTLGKQGTLHARRLAFNRTRSDLVVGKLFGDLATRYKSRAGGYTRIMKLADRRWGDAAEMAILELVDHPEIDRKRKKKAQAGADAAAQAPATAKDTMGRFKKLFAGKSKVAGGTGKGARGGAAKTGGAGRKTPAGGGSSKTGGSSS